MFSIERTIACSHGLLAFREQGAGTPLVLLHGIGSGAPSWQTFAERLASDFRVLAWDAPGYGNSACLCNATPMGVDYADVLDTLLVALNLQAPIVVGHSLGALVAASWAARASRRPRALVLASPAKGYGRSPPAEREAKLRERVDAMIRLGPQGLAAERAPRLCRPQAPAAVIKKVESVMARVSPRGYAQASHLLAHDDLTGLLPRVNCPIAVLCGSLDVITPPSACSDVAKAAGVELILLPGMAHACYVEDPHGFADAVCNAIVQMQARSHD